MWPKWVEGIFGVEAAAQHYFKKHAKNLSRKQAAMIASCLPNPILYTIKPLSAQVANRYPWILRQMNNLEADPDIQRINQIKTSYLTGLVYKTFCFFKSFFITAANFRPRYRLIG